MKRIFLPALLTALALPAFAGVPADLIKRFNDETMSSLVEKSGAGGRVEQALNFGPLLLRRIETAIAAGDYATAQDVLQQASTRLPLSDAAKKAAQDLAAALTAEQNAQGGNDVAESEQLIETAKTAIRKAKKPADLDALLEEISRKKSLIQMRRSGGDGAQNLRNRLDTIYRFLSRWQEYMVANLSGNTENAQRILRDLANSELLLVPRSEILSLASQAPSAAASPVPSEGPQRSADEAAVELIARTKRLEDLRGLIGKLQQLRAGQRDSNLISQSIQAFEQLDRYYRESLVGIYPGIDAVNGGVGSSYAAPFKAELLLMIIPKIVGAPEAKAKPGETPEDLLKRIADDARAAVDLPTAVKARELLRQLLHLGGYGNFSNDSQALNAYSTARNQEAARQWENAVVAYQSALKTGSDLLPAKLIGDQLEEIRKQHPEEYAKGMERANTPPVYPSIPYPYRSLPVMPGAPALPGAFPTPNIPGR